MATRTAIDTGVGRRPVGGWSVLVLSAVFVIAATILLYSTMLFWPPTPIGDEIPASSKVVFGSVTIELSREQNLLLIVAVLGALGAILHVLRSFFKYAGERGLFWSWVPSYFLIPFVGSVIAVITYVLLRAGLIGGTGSDEGNTWGFAAIAGLVGLFSAQATSKLKDIFETILTPTARGSDSLEGDQASAATLIDFTPTSGSVGTAVSITGARLDAVTTVRFGGGVDSPAEWSQSDKVLRTTVPDGAETGTLVVTVDGVDIESSAEFEVG